MVRKLDEHGEKLLAEVQKLFEFGFLPRGFYTATALTRGGQTAINILIIYDTDMPDMMPTEVTPK